MFKKFVNFLSFSRCANDSIPEGVWATDIQDLKVQKLVKQNYQRRFAQPESTPATHPWLFDPFSPPPGWKYDPYYEWWSKE
jgi:hypothetical protein